MRALMHGAINAATQQGATTDQVVAMGYCFGGAAVLELARSGATLQGFATFHGGLKTPEGQNYENAQAPIIVFHGSADTAITMNDFSNLAKELEQAGIKHEMISYGGAPHSFTHFGSERYRKDADEKSWARFLGFLKEVF
jgi:dienelactone hydrolase